MKKIKFKVNILNQIIIFFIILWIPLLGLDILNVRGKYYDLHVTLMNIYFVISIVIFTYIFYHLLPRRKVNHYQTKTVNDREDYIKIIKKITRMVAIISIIGILCLLYDRLFIKGINYSLGARLARYEWRGLETSTSIFGAVGNLCVPFSYVALFCSYFYFEYLNAFYKWIGIFVGIFVPLIHAFLNGGRSNLLLLICYIFTLAVLRKSSKKKVIPKFKLKKFTVIILICTLLLYILNIFYESYQFSNISFKSYVDLLVDNLGGINKNNSEGSIINNLIMIFAYLYHGKWMTGIIMMASSSQRYGFYSFVGVDDILSKLGIFLPFKHNLPLLNGAFLNVPGTLFYDFGWLGFLIFPVIISFLFALIIHKVIHKTNISLIFFIIFIFIFMFVFCSPIIPIFNLAYFNFILFAIVITEIFLKIKYKSFKWEKEI